MEKEELIEILRKIKEFDIHNFSKMEGTTIKYTCPICKQEQLAWGCFTHLKEHNEFQYLKIIPSNPQDWVSVILNLLENKTKGNKKIDITNELKNFAEDNKSEMSVNVYNGIWNIIQSIEHEKEMDIAKRNVLGGKNEKM